MNSYEEKLKQGCGKEFIFCDNDANCGDDFEYEEKVKVILCLECKARFEGFQKAKELFKKMIEGWRDKIIKNTKKRIPKAEYYDIYDEDFKEFLKELEEGQE